VKLRGQLSEALGWADAWCHGRCLDGPGPRLVCDLYDLSVGVPWATIKRERRDRRRGAV